MRRGRAASVLARLVIPVAAGAALLAATAGPASADVAMARSPALTWAASASDSVAASVAASIQASAEPCPGVTVVVDFASLGGGTVLGCADGSPTSAAQALLQAGFSQTRVQLQPGFICRIDGKPANDPCVQTPPQDAYWSFWTAPDGKPWSYASVGVDDITPRPGTAVGFAFGAGAAPSVLAPAQPTQTATSSRAPSSSTSAGPSPTRATASSGAAAGPAGTGPNPAGAPSSTAASPSPEAAGVSAAGTSPSGSSGPAHSSPAYGEPSPTSSTPGPTTARAAEAGTLGGIAPTWLGAGLVAALAVGAVLRVRRARSRR